MIDKNNKLKSLGEISLILQNTSSSITLTNGVFDMNNADFEYLSLLGKLHGVVVIGLYSNELTEKIKGKKPEQDEKVRADFLSSFEFVDHVLILNSQKEVYESIYALPLSVLCVLPETEDVDNNPEKMRELFETHLEVRILTI